MSTYISFKWQLYISISELEIVAKIWQGIVCNKLDSSGRRYWRGSLFLGTGFHCPSSMTTRLFCSDFSASYSFLAGTFCGDFVLQGFGICLLMEQHTQTNVMKYSELKWRCKFLNLSQECIASFAFTSTIFLVTVGSTHTIDFSLVSSSHFLKNR